MVMESAVGVLIILFFGILYQFKTLTDSITKLSYDVYKFERVQNDLYKKMEKREIYYEDYDDDDDDDD